MKKYITLFLLTTLFHLSAFSLFAIDFGLVFNQDADIIVPDFDFESANYDISGVLMPRITALLGETGDLYVSAAVNYKLDPMSIIPELTRTDLSLNLKFADIRFGRMFYSDPLQIIANGLFDGAGFSFITRSGNFHAGIWYTGFLYKKRAAITMTSAEEKSNYSNVDYGDFANTYFAPSRILTAFEYGHPSIAGFIGLKTSIIAQFDLGDDNLNSQYLTLSLSLPAKSVIFDLGGCFELIENNDDIIPAFAAELGITWILPAVMERHIKLSARYSSGVSDDETIGAFLPLTTVPQGELVEAKFSGLSLLSLDFTGRLAKVLSANMSFTYFIRNDLGTYSYYPVTDAASEGFFLGAEIFGRLMWTISTGIRLNLGTGVFLPVLGDAAPDAEILWRTKLNLVISIF
jgi:hypothetical protein